MEENTIVAQGLSPTVKVASPDFDEKRLSGATLCIEIDATRFRFCVVKSETLECQWLEDYAFDTFLNEGEYLAKVKTIVSEHPFLTSDQWKDVRVAVNTDAFTLVPVSLFRREYAADYLKLATGTPLQSHDRVFSQQLPYVNAQVIFTVPVRWADWLLGLFPLQNVSFYHLASALVIGAVVSHSEYDQSRLLTVHIENNHFSIIYTQDKALQLCNRFPYRNALELTYLVLFCMNQLQILPDDTHVRLYGEVTPFSDVYTELARFLPHLRFGRNPSTIRYIEAFEDIPEHRYFGLLNTYLITS